MSLKDKYKRELDRIREEEGGTITAETVVDKARDLDSPLHDYFDWDDKRLADAARRDEARALIRTYLKLVVTEYNVKLEYREFVHDPDLTAKTGGGYIEAVAIKDDPAKAQRVVLERARAIVTQISNVKNLAEMWQLEDAVDWLGMALKPMVDLVEAYKAEDSAPAPAPTPPPRRPRRGGGGENRLRP